MANEGSFPSTKAEVLALEWLKQQDLNLSAEALLAKYDEYVSALRHLIAKQNARDFNKANP